MTRVDFYILPQSDDAARLQFVCRLAEKAWRAGKRMLIHTADSKSLEQLDEMLWSFRADSFLPHERLPASARVPVQLGCAQESGDHHDLLINLGGEIPTFFSRFDRVAEIVIQQPEHLKLSRERFRFYRDRGYALETHDMGKRA